MYQLFTPLPWRSAARRTRRLLAIYPAEHRRKHQDEMLGVLMTGAHAGQHRPGLRDTSNLIWGALLIRLRPARRGTAWPLWRDALGVVSVLLPLIVLAYFTLLNLALLATLRVGSPIFDALARADAKTLGGWLIVAVLVLLRLRRTAALAAPAFLIWMAYSSSDGVNWSYIDAPSMLESTSGWVGPWRITVTILPFAMLACVALAATLHAIRRTPAHGQEA